MRVNDLFVSSLSILLIFFSSNRIHLNGPHGQKMDGMDGMDK